MADTACLEWPFFESRHAELARSLEQWTGVHIHSSHGPDVDTESRALVRALGQAGGLRHALACSAHGEAGESIDTRAICLIRGTLAGHSGLSDFALAMQGLGSGAMSLYGTPEQRERNLARVAAGEAIVAFALSEPDAGSYVAAMACAARAGSDEQGEHYLLHGEKTWISNGGIASFFMVFTRTGEALGARGIAAFIVETGVSGFEIAERIDVIAPHPLARLRFSGCSTANQRVGAAGEGFKVAMRTLDVFRTLVAAAALGFARRALDEAIQRATTRRMFLSVLANSPLTQAKLARMATATDSAAVLTYRAAWQRDRGQNVIREAAMMAKMTATETAQLGIDAAVQMFGGLGVVSELPVERLYREIRALRIYEDATEVQQIISACELLRAVQTAPTA